VAWAETIIQCLKDANVRLVPYVPDVVLAPLISGLEADDWFHTVEATREDEAIGIAVGAFFGGVRSVVLMQTSGFGNVSNALASLAVPYQVPLLMLISERGTLGEFNPAQVHITRSMRPTLDTLTVLHHTLERPDELAFLVSRAALQCFRTQWPTALILSPLLTGGKEV
jgi:sulfopyruvate decarboxylase alpha subunit